MKRWSLPGKKASHLVTIWVLEFILIQGVHPTSIAERHGSFVRLMFHERNTFSPLNRLLDSSF